MRKFKIKFNIKIHQSLDKLIPFATKITGDRNKLILAGIVVLAILFIDFSFVLTSQRRGVRAVNSEIARLSKSLSDLEADLVKMQRQEVGLPASQEKGLVSVGQLPWVIEELSRLSNEQGVKIFQVRLARTPLTQKASGRPAETKQYLSVLINIEGSAGYHQLGRFLAALESHSVFMEVKELSIGRREKNPFEHDINLVLRTYVNE